MLLSELERLKGNTRKNWYNLRIVSTPHYKGVIAKDFLSPHLAEVFTNAQSKVFQEFNCFEMLK